MALNSKFIPLLAFGIALILIGCFPALQLTGSGYSAVETGTQEEETAQFEFRQPDRDINSCETCQLFVKSLVPQESNKFGRDYAPFRVTSAVDFPISGFSYQAIDIISSRRFALYRSSLFHQATLIRI